jgi:hypothetical protein
MSKNQWIATAVLAQAIAFVLGGLAGYLFICLMGASPPQIWCPVQSFVATPQPPTVTPTTEATPMPTLVPPTATREPPTPTSTSVVPVATYVLPPGPTLIPLEAVAPDDWESDDSLAEANPIEMDNSQSHNLHVVGDHDWVYFEAEEGATYVVETSNLGGGIDTIIFLYDEEEKELLSDDDGGAEFWASRIQWTATEASRLYMMVGDLGDNDAGPRTSYDISLSLGEAFEMDEYEPNDSRAEANRIRVGETQAHNLHIAGDRDWVYFEAVAGRTYVIETSNLGGRIDTIIDLYDEAWNELASDDDKGGEFLASHLEWMADRDGTVYVVIEDWGGNVAGPGTEYDISLSRM